MEYSRGSLVIPQRGTRGEPVGCHGVLVSGSSRGTAVLTYLRACVRCTCPRACVCVRVCVSVYMGACSCMRLWVCVRVSWPVFWRVCACLCVCAHVCACVCVAASMVVCLVGLQFHRQASSHACVCVCVCVCVFVFVERLCVYGWALWWHGGGVRY